MSERRDKPRAQKLACHHRNIKTGRNDLWEPLNRIFDAFGFDRCLWGTDWTRAVNLITYEQGVEPFRLTDSISQNDKLALMGGSLAKIYKWKPAAS